jgi:hypothetical protein
MENIPIRPLNTLQKDTNSQREGDKGEAGATARRRAWWLKKDRGAIGLLVRGIVYFEQSSHDRGASEKGRSLGGLCLPICRTTL